VSEKRLERLRTILVTRFNILWTLYPDYTYSQTQLAELSDTDPGNLSRYLKELDNDGIVTVKEEQPGVGRPAKLISLTNDTKSILAINMRFFLAKEAFDELEPEKTKKILELLSNKDTRILAADELELASRNYIATIESKMYPDLVDYLKKQEYRDIAHTLLRSLHNFIAKLDDVSRKEATYILSSPLRDIYDKEDDSDKGIRIKRRILEIFEVLNIYSMSYEKLKEECIEAVLYQPLPMSPVLIDRITRLLPEEKMDLRLSLLERYGSANEEQKKRLQSMLIQLR
jgi:DNA-binding MarR family transcriptional regulator